MTRIYKKYSTIIVDDGATKMFFNPDDVRLMMSGNVFMLNDAQLGRTFTVGVAEDIVDESDTLIGDVAACEDYILSLIVSVVSSSTGSGSPDPESNYMKKVIKSNTAGTYTVIEFYRNAADSTPFAVQTIKEGVPDETIDDTKTIEIINS